MSHTDVSMCASTMEREIIYKKNLSQVLGSRLLIFSSRHQATARGGLAAMFEPGGSCRHIITRAKLSARFCGLVSGECDSDRLWGWQGVRRGRHLSACDTRALERLALLVVAVCVAVDATYRYAVSVTVLWQLGKGAKLTGYDQAVERERNTNTWIPISGAWRS